MPLYAMVCEIYFSAVDLVNHVSGLAFINSAKAKVKVVCIERYHENGLIYQDMNNLLFRCINCSLARFCQLEIFFVKIYNRLKSVLAEPA